MQFPTHESRTPQHETEASRTRIRSLAAAVLVGLLVAGTAGSAHAADPTDTSNSPKPTATGTPTSDGLGGKDGRHDDETGTEDGWLFFTVEGADEDTRVYHSGVPGGGQLISVFQQPGPDDGKDEDDVDEQTLTFTTDEPVVAARAATLNDGAMSPSAGDALPVNADDGHFGVTVDSTEESQVFYLLPEQTPVAADPDEQNVLQKAWATVVELITGAHDHPTGVDNDDTERDQKSPDTEGLDTNDDERPEPTIAPTSPAAVTDEACNSTDANAGTKSQDTTTSNRDPSSDPTGPAPAPAAAGGESCTVNDGDDGDLSGTEFSDTSDEKPDEAATAVRDDEKNDASGRITMENEASGLPFMLGASGEDVASGEYAEALGRGIDIAATWANDNENMVALPQLQPGGEYGDWDKAIDISIGAIDQNSGETWAKAAAGAYDDRWTDSLTTMRKLRQEKSGTTFIRFAHEWNGSWFSWSVDRADTENFKKAWQHFADLAEENYPEAKLVMSQNRESNGYEGDWTDAFPGADAVDVMNVDYYNNWPYAATLEEFESHLDQTDGFGGPKGLAAHSDFAASVGLPLSLGEWSGVDGDEGGDSPAFIEGMFDFFSDHAGTGAGDVLYACQFEVTSAANGKFKLLRGSGLPDSSEAFKQSFGTS